jgi:hypothetical protein
VNIFQYRDGLGRRKSVDPLAAEQSLSQGLGPDWWGALASLRSRPSPHLVGESLAAWHSAFKDRRAKVLPEVCAAFNVGRYGDDPAGLTVLELVGLADGFRAFCGGLVEAAAPFRECVLHGLPFPRKPTYPEWFGLYLCRRRLSADRQAAGVDSLLSLLKKR